jgi:mono/diheme cytochrome c family protein
VKVTPAGKVVPVACGFREPCGVGVSPSGDIFVTDQQGDYIGSSPLIHVEPGKFYGHPASFKWSPDFPGAALTESELANYRTPPSIVLPHGSMGGSPGQPVWDTTQGKFGPFEGQVLIGDFTKLVSRCDLEMVSGQWQGACFSFLRDAVGEVAISQSSGSSNLTVPAGKDGQQYFRDVAPRPGVPLRQGTMRMAFAPDGSLYLGQTTRGWGFGDGLQRVVWTGRQPVDLLRMRLTERGFRLQFTTPMQSQALTDKSRYRLERFRYIYHHNYGSPRLDTEEVDIVALHLSEANDAVELELSELHPGFIYELLLDDLVSAEGHPLRFDHAYYTLNRTIDGRKYEGEITAGSEKLVAAEKARPPDPKLGRRVYQTFCVQCHRPDGRGGGLPGMGPADFTQVDGVLTKPDHELVMRIGQGVPGKTMPPFGFVLTEQQIADVLAFLRDEFQSPVATVSEKGAE